MNHRTPAPTDRDGHLTGNQVAALLGVTRRTVYHWADQGRIPPAWNWRHETIAPLAGVVTKRRRGPARNPRSTRYTTGRHRFER